MIELEIGNYAVLPEKNVPNLGQIDVNRAEQVFALNILEQILGMTERILDARLVRAYDDAAHVRVDYVRSQTFEFVYKLFILKSQHSRIYRNDFKLRVQSSNQNAKFLHIRLKSSFDGWIEEQRVGGLQPAVEVNYLHVGERVAEQSDVFQPILHHCFHNS